MRRIEMGFNQWLYERLGVFSDDMTDEDYDMYYKQWLDWKEAQR